MKKTERLHAITEMLRRHGQWGCTAEKLAAEFSVSVRTIKRDLAALQNAGLPIWSRTGPGGGYGLAERSTLPPINLTASQAVALLAAVEAASDAPYSDQARAGVLKIVDVLDPLTRRTAEQLADRVWVDSERPPSRSIMSALEKAMTQQVVVRMDYRDGAGNSTSRDVEPVMFASMQGRWYLVGWCRLREAMRWFNLGRIQRASATRLHCGDHTVAEVGFPPTSARPVFGRAMEEPFRRLH